MAIPVIIYGKSGTGKSRSLAGFEPDGIYLINTIGKPLPFRKQFRYISTTDNVKTMMAGLSKMSTKAAVVDDFSYTMINEFMRRHGSGDQFKLYDNIADMAWSFIQFIQSPAVPADAVVYLIMHEDTADDGTNKLRLIGKLLENKVMLEGMVTVVLRATIKGGRHVFQTQNDGASIAKSPEGMFDAEEIDNDLAAVDDAIRKYWELPPRVTAPKADKKKEGGVNNGK